MMGVAPLNYQWSCQLYMHVNKTRHQRWIHKRAVDWCYCRCTIAYHLQPVVSVLAVG